MRILALDTATEACSVALGDDRTCLAERWLEAPRAHGEHLFGLIDAVLADAGTEREALDVIAFGCGPGAFTGVRLGTAVAQGIARALARPLAPVSTLAALAQGGYRRHGAVRWLPAIDARMGEVYWGAYTIDDGLATATGEPCVVAPDAVPVPRGGGWHALGTGWARHGEALAACLGTRLAHDHGHALPTAVDLLPLARDAHARGTLVGPAEALPVYLRDRVVRTP